jgi:mannose-6-phosphate isomerase-like protein (cupin superfamily)
MNLWSQATAPLAITLFTKEPWRVLIRNLRDCPEFTAGDGTLLRELLHPDKQPLAIRYSLAQAIVPVGQTSLPHSLTTSEIYYILSGQGQMTIDQTMQAVEPGDVIYIPPNAKQFICNIGAEPLIFICIVDPAWRQADETIHADERSDAKGHPSA